MVTITKISTQNRKNRFNVEIDGEFAFGVSDVLLARENLYKGKELDAAEVERLKQSAEEEKLYDKALRFLSYRPRSSKEVFFYLERKLKPSVPSEPSMPSFPKQEVLKKVLDHLERENYLNDKEFARWLVKQRLEAKMPRGVRLIKQELQQKGVAREVIDSVLGDFVETLHEASLQEGNNHTSLIENAARAVLTRYKGLEEPVFKRWLYSFLLRRGFEWEEVKRVVDEVAQERYTDGHGGNV